jgi:hypothetical protein
VKKEKGALRGLLPVRTPTRMTFPKLKKALLSAITGDVRIDRKYDGVIERGRSIHKRTAGVKGIKGNGGK